ncbi:MAG: hypothetical protein J6A01_09410 [Proteobacteria bacterium]|nr:hypothetical protein [Pseudomonadota bacterium]
MKSSIKVIPLVIAGLWAACNLSPVSAQEFNLEQMVLAGKKVKQVQSPKDYQLYHATTPIAPNSSQGASHGPLLMKQSDGKILQVADDIIFSTLSPEGKVFFSGSDLKLYTINAAGKAEHIADNVSADFAFDKTGKQILVSRPTDFVNSTLDILGADGKLIRHVLPEGNYFVPTFTPDGSQILFASGDSGIVSWYLVNTDGSHKRQLTNIGMESGNMTDDFVPVMNDPENSGFIDNTHFKYMEGPDTWILDITTGKALRADQK